MLETALDFSSKQQLHNAWILRWNQRIEESMLCLAEIQAAEQWTQLEVQELANKKAYYEPYLEALLLKGALWRAQGQEKKSSAWLRRILNTCQELQLPLTFRLLFELGLDSWRHEDTAQALDYFLLADRKTRNLVEQAFTQSNVLWCLESLDLDRRQFEEKVADCLSRIMPHEIQDVKHVQEQWTAYLLRKDFYQKLNLQTSTISGQGLFFEKWVSALPYSSPKAPEFTELNASYLWQGSYRLRTLAGVWAPADKTCLRIGDGIDRLYLWVWKWMAGQDISKEKVLWTLESILEQLDVSELSKENSLLLRNAISWMALADSVFAKKHHKLLQRLQTLSSPHYSVLNTEFALINCFAYDDSDDLIPSLQQFPVFAKIFSQGLNFTSSGLLPELQKILKEKENLKKSNHDIIANFHSGEIRLQSQGKIVRSRKLLFLLQQVHTENKLALSDIPNDSEDPRFIYNLFGRLRNIFPTKSFSIEGGFFVKGKNWPRIQFIHQQDNDFSKTESDFDLQAKTSLVDSESYLQAAKALLPKPFLRKEMEQALKVSKATACRMLEGWIENGHLTKSGQARAVRYHWRKDV